MAKTFSRLRVTEANVTVGSPAYDSLHRNRTDYDRQKLVADALRAYRLNPKARRIIKLYRQFAIGSQNLKVELQKKPTGLFSQFASKPRIKATEEFIHKFWQHPINNLDSQLPEWFDERSLTGDLFVLFSVDPSGMPLVRAIPSETITSIDTAENDHLQETTYHTGTLDDKVYYAYNPITRTNPPFVRHYVINRPVGCNFGESDLFPILPLIARHTGWLENRANLNFYRSLFMWVVTGQYPSEADRQARQNEIAARPPTTASILVKNENETWEALAPRLDAADAGEDGLALKKEIALGAGIPLHYLAEPESSTRTTAEAAGTPSFRNLQDYQQTFFNAIRDLLTIACSLYQRVNSQVMTTFELEIHGQDISERDNATLALAFARSVPQVAELYDRHMIDTAEFLRLAYGFAGEVYDEQPSKEGHRRPLSDRSKPPPSPNSPSPLDPKTDPEDKGETEDPIT